MKSTCGEFSWLDMIGKVTHLWVYEVPQVTVGMHGLPLPVASDQIPITEFQYLLMPILFPYKLMTEYRARMQVKAILRSVDLRGHRPCSSPPVRSVWWPDGKHLVDSHIMRNQILWSDETKIEVLASCLEESRMEDHHQATTDPTVKPAGGSIRPRGWFSATATGRLVSMEQVRPVELLNSAACNVLLNISMHNN